MSKETRDQKTLSVANSLNRDRDTINNSVNRETIGDELTAIRNGEPTNESYGYGNNGYAKKSSGGTGVVTIRMKDWGAVSQERKGTILRMVGEYQNISDYGRYAS